MVVLGTKVLPAKVGGLKHNCFLCFRKRSKIDSEKFQELLLQQLQTLANGQKEIRVGSTENFLCYFV
ncbi:MAG TPA: hypothetical protein DCZ10_14990, partial [Pelotomaculum sp.]|nr:hypothetical protein [Pelotomaculum sp.]